MRRVLAAALVLAACGSALPPPDYTAERPAGSGTWAAIDALPPWVAAPPATSSPGTIPMVLDSKSNFRSLAVGVQTWVEREAVKLVESRLAPAVGDEDAARAAKAATTSLRLVDRVAKEELLTRDVVVGNTLATVWSLWEIGIDPVVAALPEEKRAAARAALGDRD